MNNNTKLYNIKVVLYPLISYLYCWLVITIVIFLSQNMIEYDSCLVLCDSAGSSTEQFFMGETDRSDNNNSHNDSGFFSDYSSQTHVCSSILDKYTKIGRRKIYWFVAQKGKGNYPNYEEFKKSWDPKMNIISELKKQFKSEVENSARKLSVTKRSVSWFLRGSKPGGGRGL
jgi:hypothetical protein